MSRRSFTCHLKWNKMKIYFLFVFFSSSFNAFSSSPVTKKTSQAYNDMIEKLESTTNRIMPLLNNFSALERHAEVTDGKAAATAKSSENRENMIDSYASFNEKNITPYLSNASGHSSEDLFNKEKTNGKTADSFNDVILKMKSSMYDYFSNMHRILKRVANEKDNEPGLIPTSNENKEDVIDRYLNFKLKNEQKHLDKASSDLWENALNEVKNNVSTSEEYNNAIQSIESFMKDIMPKVDDYFSNMLEILRNQEEQNTVQSISIPYFMKKKDKNEADISSNVLKNNNSSENISIDQHEIDLSKMDVKENILDVDGYSNNVNEIIKKHSHMKEKMPKTEIIPLKMHHVLKRNAKKGEAKIMSTSKPIENKNNIASASVKDDNEPVSKVIDDQSKNKINNLLTTERSSVNQVDGDLIHDIQVELSNSIADAKVNSIESKSENKQSSGGKMFDVSSSEKEILNDKNKDILLKMNDIDEDSSKNDYNPKNVNKSTLRNLNLHLIRRNKDFVETANSGNILEKKHPEELQTEIVSTNGKYIKQKQEEINAKLVTASKVEFANQEKIRHMINEMSYSKDHIPKNYQKDLFSKTDPTMEISTQLVDKNEVKIIKSEIFNSGNHMINQERSDDKTSSLISSSDHAKENKESFTKDTKGISDKIKSLKNKKKMTE